MLFLPQVPRKVEDIVIKKKKKRSASFSLIYLNCVTKCSWASGVHGGRLKALASHAGLRPQGTKGLCVSEKARRLIASGALDSVTPQDLRSPGSLVLGASVPAQGPFPTVVRDL